MRAVGPGVGLEGVERTLHRLFHMQPPPVRSRGDRAGPAPPPLFSFPGEGNDDANSHPPARFRSLRTLSLPLPQEVSHGLHVILKGEHLGGDAVLIRALRMHAMMEEGAHGGDVAVGGSKVQRGGAGRGDDGRGGVSGGIAAR